MLNQCILVGKVVSLPIATNEHTIVVIDIKNTHDEQSEELPISLSKSLQYALEYLKVGSIIGVKARLHNNEGMIEIQADKLTFINSKQDD